MADIRINKYISNSGLCSRREADRLIEEGEVTVDGLKAYAGMKLTGNERVLVKGRLLQGSEEKVVLAFYKPVGVTCTNRDVHAKKTISDVIDYPIRVTYAGRLDQESEGLLILSNDGRLIDRMMSPKNKCEKEYLVRLTKPIGGEFKEAMEKGIFLKELNRKTKPCRVTIMDTYNFKIVLTQGLNKQIRRMCQALGYRVDGLLRLRVGNILLGRLQVGTYRRINGEELNDLYKLVGLNER